MNTLNILIIQSSLLSADSNVGRREMKASYFVHLYLARNDDSYNGDINLV